MWKKGIVQIGVYSRYVGLGKNYKYRKDKLGCTREYNRLADNGVCRGGVKEVITS